MGFFEFDESFEAAAPLRRPAGGAALHETELFFEALTGSTTPTTPPRAQASRGHAWARRVFDDVSRQGLAPGGVISGASDGSKWRIVAGPGSTPSHGIRPGDLVVKRAGETEHVKVFVTDATIATRDLFKPDGRVRDDTLVLRAETDAPPLTEPDTRGREDVDDDAETVPTFAVGAADVLPRTFVEMTAHVEDWIANAAGTGVVVSQFACRTQAELDATMPSAAVTMAKVATPLWHSNAAGRLEAALDLLILHPAAAAGGTTLPAGRHPLAIVCHGNHQVREFDPATHAPFEVFSHRGYSNSLPAQPAPQATGPYLQEALAEKGIISVSVSTNAANLLGLMLETRARFVIAALKRMQQLDLDPSSRYHRRIDFQRVALIGHSRGGDAVARAASLVASNTRVRAVVQLAPTDSTGLLQGAAPAITRPPGAPNPTFATRPVTMPARSAPRQLIVWGSRDGDVSGLQDVRTDVSVNPFRHYDRSSVERAFQYWHGATHNRFNRLWRDADEDDEILCLTRIGTTAGLMTRADQEARTIEMVRAWLLFALFDEVVEAQRFDGRTPTAVAPSLPIGTMWKFGSRLATIDQFDDVKPDLNTLGGANVTPSTGVFDEITVANENGAGAGVTAYQFPHIDRALRFSPAPQGLPPVTVPGLPTALHPPVWRTTIPAGSRDFRRFDLVTFRVTKKYDPAKLKAALATPPTGSVSPPKVLVRLIGPTPAVTGAVAASSPLATLPFLRLLPKIAGPHCPNADLDLTKIHFETWQVALSAYAPMSIADIHFVELEIDTDIGQPVYVDTLSLVKRP